jgi:hypothetical protein
LYFFRHKPQKMNAASTTHAEHECLGAPTRSAFYCR